MKKGTSVAILAAAIGISGVASIAYADKDDDRREEQRRSDRSDHPNYRDALQDLKRAREILSTTGGNWDGRRQQALQQTNYAIEQCYAAIGDDAAKARDQEEARRLADEGRDRRSDRDNLENRRRDMNSALDRLSSARQALIRVPSDDSRRQKSIDFTEQAIKDVQMAIANYDRNR